MFQDNAAQSRFERPTPEGMIFASYRREGPVVSILHVETPVALRGQGEAGKLMQDIAGYARANGLKIFPICPYAVAWLNRHAEMQDLLA